jgi:RecA/RadA recombinase
MYWEAQPIVRKRQQRHGEPKNNSTKVTATDEDDNNSEQQQQQQQMSEQIKKLQDELKTKDTEVNRWKEVNNKLMFKLNSK